MEAPRTRTRETRIGHNRTGIKASPLDSRALERTASDAPPPPSPETLQATALRMEYTHQADTLGSVPPPATMKAAMH